MGEFFYYGKTTFKEKNKLRYGVTRQQCFWSLSTDRMTSAGFLSSAEREEFQKDSDVSDRWSEIVAIDLVLSDMDWDPRVSRYTTCGNDCNKLQQSCRLQGSSNHA